MRKITLSKIAYRIKLLLGRPKCIRLARSLVKGKAGIEVGGPSPVFQQWYTLPIYSSVGSLDNCDFSQSTIWASHGDAYKFDKSKAPGKMYFCEGNDLQAVADHQYDFLLSSHNLEHFANPVKALKEWQRVVKPGGHIILLLPHYEKTFDEGRPLTTVEHMLADYEMHTGEDDLTHVEEVYEARRPRGEATDELRAVLLSNFSHRKMHHHVFNEVNSRELLEAVGLKVLAVETALPFHIILLAQTPQ